jgi:Na+-driven multidrug efflux pump
MAGLAVLLLLITRFYCHKKYIEVTINFKRYFDKNLLKEMSGFAGWNFLGASSSMLSFYGQGIVLNMFFGTIVNAAQGIANQISGQLGVFAHTMMKALNPIIAKSEGAGDRKLMLKASVMGSKISLYLLFFFYVPFLIEMPFIFEIWLKDVPEYAIVFCRLVLLQNLIEQLGLPLTTSISAVGNIRNFQFVKSIFYLLPLPLSFFIFSLGYDPYSLYYVYIIFAFVQLYITLFFARKLCGLDLNSFVKNVMAKSLFILVLLFSLSALPLFVMDVGFLRLIVVTAVSFTSFLIFIWKIGLDADEKNMMKLYVLHSISAIKRRSNRWI